MELQTIGRYQLLSEIARGGMATVYLAQDPRFEREVAIKVLPRVFMDDPTFRARFSREAKLFAALDHPAIVPVYDFGEENGQPYLVMRLMKGGALGDKIKHGPIAMPEVLRVLRRIAAALDHAHDQGIVHRDIKPSNVLFDQYQDAFLSDFGISRQPDSELTQTGVMSIGTPGYMSPEQIEGNQVDRRSDVYSLGILCYEMIAGKRMYKANTPTMMVVKQMTQPPPLLEEVSPESARYQPVIDRALAKDPAQRFGKASEFVEALAPLAQAYQATVIGLQPIKVPPPAPAPEKPSQPPVEAEKVQPPVVESSATFIDMAPVVPPLESKPVLTQEPVLPEIPAGQEKSTGIVLPEPVEPPVEPLKEPEIAPPPPAAPEPTPETPEPPAWNVMATVVSARPVELEELLKQKAEESKRMIGEPTPIPPEEPVSPYEESTQVDMEPIVIPQPPLEPFQEKLAETAPIQPDEPASPFEVSTQIDMAPISIPRPSFDEPATYIGEAEPEQPIEPISPFEASTQVDMEPIVMPEPAVSPFEASTQVDMEPIVMPETAVSPFEASTQVDMAPIVPGQAGAFDLPPQVEKVKEPEAVKVSPKKTRTGRKVHPILIVGVIGLVILVIAGVLFWLFSGEYLSSANCLLDPGPGLLVVKSPHAGSATIDGRISSPLEWSRAYCADVMLEERREGPVTRKVRWWIKHNDDYLYFLVRVPKNIPVGGMFVNYFWPKYENEHWARSDAMGVTTSGVVDDSYGWNEIQWFLDEFADPPGRSNVEGAVREDSEYWWFEAKKELDSMEKYDWGFRPGIWVGSTNFDHFLIGIWTKDTYFTRLLQLHITLKQK